MLRMYDNRTYEGGVPVESGNVDLGRVLKELRERQGVSLLSAARALGTERHATIAEIESGKRRVTFDETVTLASLYGVGVGDVMSALSGVQEAVEVDVALPRAAEEVNEADRLALARLEGLAREYARLKRVARE
jgi:transcriptional regulator with XRE-family HTH domain